MNRGVGLRQLVIAAEAVLFVILLFVIWDRSITVSQVSLTDRSGTYIEGLPVLRPVGANQLIQLSLTGVRGAGSLVLTPDDCFERVSRNGRPIYQGCESLTVEISSEPTRLDLLIRNTHGGPSGVHVAGMHRLRPVIALIAAALAMHLCWLLARTFGVSKVGGIIALLGILARIIYLSDTDIYTHTYDIIQRGGHLDYIRQVAGTLQRPNPLSGWEYHQPLPYYMLGAMVYRLWHNVMPGYMELQLMSLALSSVFMIFGILALERLAPSKSVAVIACTLLTFFPSAIIHSSRPGNDGMVYPLAAASLYFLVLWEQGGRNQNFLWSLGSAALAFATKASGLPVLLTCLLLAVSRFRLRLAALSLLTLCLVYGLFYPLARSSASPSQTASVETFVGASMRKLNPDLSAHSLFAAECLNPLPYLSSAFVNPWDETTGSKCFSVYFLKSMLFGEFQFGSLEAWHLSFLLLGVGTLMWFGLLISAAHIPRAALLFTITHLLVQLVYYSTLHISPAADFRYALPILIPLALGGATALAKLRLLEAGIRLLGPKAEGSVRS